MRLFRELHLMEEWGSGVKRVVAALAAEGLGAPEFVELPGRLRVIVPISLQLPNGDELVHPNEAHSEDDREDDREVVRLTEKAVAVLRAAAGRPMHRDDLFAAIGLGTAYGNYKRHIAPLIEQGLLALTIPEAPTSKNQRYKTTPKGRKALANL